MCPCLSIEYISYSVPNLPCNLCRSYHISLSLSVQAFKHERPNVIPGCIRTDYEIMTSFMSNENYGLPGRLPISRQEFSVCIAQSLSAFPLFETGAWWCRRRVCRSVTSRCRQVQGNDQLVDVFIWAGWRFTLHCMFIYLFCICIA